MVGSTFFLLGNGHVAIVSFSTLRWEGNSFKSLSFIVLQYILPRLTILACLSLTMAWISLSDGNGVLSGVLPVETVVRDRLAVDAVKTVASSNNSGFITVLS